MNLGCDPGEESKRTVTDLKTMWTPEVKNNCVLLDKFYHRKAQTNKTNKNLSPRVQLRGVALN